MQTSAADKSNPPGGWQRWGYVGIGLIFLLGNLGIVPLFSIWTEENDSDAIRRTLLLLWTSALVVQTGLLAIYGVWGTSPFYARLLKIIFAEVLLVLALWLGLLLTELSQIEAMNPGLRRERLAIIFLPPVVMLLSQIPLWFAKLCLGWRLIRLGTKEPAYRWSQFSIGDLMGATLVVAILISCNHWFVVFSGDEESHVTYILRGWRNAILVATFFITLPAVWGVFRPQTLNAGLPYLAVYCIACNSLALLLTMQFGIKSIAISLTSLTIIPLGLLVPLLIARSQGYRLIWGRETEYLEKGAKSTTEDTAGV